MSGIAGIYNRDGRDVDPVLLSRMTGAISHRGLDGSGEWISGPVGLGHQMLWTTPESTRERQPLCDDTATRCLTFDGRIDNRKDLKRCLEANGVKLRMDTDAEMVLAAYECWGSTSPNRLLGDFAFAIWDGRHRRLFCARDILGMRPFYYFADGHTFLFASELQQVLQMPSVPCEPNEGMIGEYLASVVNNKNETLYKRIFRLPPAHFLIITPDRVRMDRYWDIDPAKVIRYRSDKEYADHFLDIFREAVCCRMRAHGRVGAQLSGGLDSSSVSCVARSLINTGAISENGFETFSMVFPGWRCDESEYIEAVKTKSGIKSNALHPDVPERSWYEAQVARYLDIPDYPNGSMSDSMEDLARKKGFRVLLTGLGGDEWFTGSYYHYADFLRQFRILSLVREARHEFGKSALMPLPSNPLLNYAFKPLIPENISTWIRRIKNHGKTAHDWIDPRLARSINLTQRLYRTINWTRFSSFAQGGHYIASTSGFQTHAIEMEERSASSFGIELRHPFHDRRLLEFGLALPEEQRSRANHRKLIIRRAMGDYLPKTVLHRHTKAEFSRVFVRALKVQGGVRLFDSLSVADAGWVDEREIKFMYRRLDQPDTKNDEDFYDNVWPLWHVFGIELWFNHMFKNRRASQVKEVDWPKTQGR
jgi:asparagine synthase (glutamine-hydrolysing)